MGHAHRVLIVTRQFAAQKAFLQPESHHQESDRNDCEQRRGVRFQPQTQAHEDQWGSGVERVSNYPVYPGVHDNMLALALQTKYGGCESIRSKRKSLDPPTERKQNQSEVGEERR